MELTGSRRKNNQKKALNRRTAEKTIEHTKQGLFLFFKSSLSKITKKMTAVNDTTTDPKLVTKKQNAKAIKVSNANTAVRMILLFVSLLFISLFLRSTVVS